MEYYKEEKEEEKVDDEEKMDKEDDEVNKEMYKDVNVNLENEDADMTDADQGGTGQQNVSHAEAILLLAREGFSRFRSLLVKSKEIEELCIGLFVFCVSRTDACKVYNWEIATYGKIWYDEDVHDLRSVETQFPAIVFDNALTSKVTPSYEPTASPLNDNKIDFRLSFEESDDEDYTVIYDENSFSYKIIFVDNLKTDTENDNDKVNMPSFSSSDPEVKYSNDLDFFKDFENEFSAIVYNDALTSKSDFLTKHIELYSVSLSLGYDVLILVQ
nr:hypothetical protein [Tanacetum cinerariifolium]